MPDMEAAVLPGIFIFPIKAVIKVASRGTEACFGRPLS